MYNPVQTQFQIFMIICTQRTFQNFRSVSEITSRISQTIYSKLITSLPLYFCQILNKLTAIYESRHVDHFVGTMCWRNMQISLNFEANSIYSLSASYRNQTPLHCFNILFRLSFYLNLFPRSSFCLFRNWYSLLCKILKTAYLSVQLAVTMQKRR